MLLVCCVVAYIFRVLIGVGLKGWAHGYEFAELSLSCQICLDHKPFDLFLSMVVGGVIRWMC